MNLEPGLAWGRQRLQPRYRTNGWPDCATDVELFHEVPLGDALNYTLYKFVFFNKTMNDWAPDRKLTIEPLGESMELPPDHRSFWRGTEAELILERERLEKQR